MADSPSFASGKGLHVHIRTTIENGFSYVSSVALKIGSDILEVRQFGKFIFNGKEDYLPEKIDDFPLLFATTCKNKEEVKDGAPCDVLRKRFVIDLGNEEEIKIKAFKSVLNVELGTKLDDAIGLMGSPGTGINGMVGRDGETVFTDPNLFGAEWQVTADEPMLFQTIRAPQYPAVCLLPTKQTATGRRLGAARAAEEACTIVPSEHKESCIFDIIQTGDVDMAQAYIED